MLAHALLRQPPVAGFDGVEHAGVLHGDKLGLARLRHMRMPLRRSATATSRCSRMTIAFAAALTIAASKVLPY
jgi:hypothetical protein